MSEAFPQWLEHFPFLFVPALPYFAMHVSETALLSSIYVLLGVGHRGAVPRRTSCAWADGAGTGRGLMLAGGRSPWPLADSCA